MSGAESFVQVAVDGAGKAIDTFAVINLLTGATQQRQAVVVADPAFAANVAGVTGGGDAQVRNFTLEDLLTQVLVELRVINILLHSTLNSRDDIDLLRQQEGLVSLQQTQ